MVQKLSIFSFFIFSLIQISIADGPITIDPNDATISLEFRTPDYYNPLVQPAGIYIRISNGPTYYLPEIDDGFKGVSAFILCQFSKKASFKLTYNANASEGVLNGWRRIERVYL